MFSELLKITNKDGVSFGTASNVYSVYPTTLDKDIFESVIDGLILERYATEDIKEYIKSLPINKKRVATLSIIGDDHVLWSKMNDILKEEKSGYRRLKDIYLLLKDYVKIADVERKKHGEILTPFKELAEPMIRLVEKYDSEFWKNKNHKVLDSSAGYGTFLILAAYKFMVGLKDEIPDEEERFKWVVENCLYYGELQAKSVFSWLVAIDPYNEYKTNIYWGSFLTKDFDEHMKNVWNVESFDLIIQNPPYQEQKEGFTKTQPIWHLFVNKSINIITYGKYLIMVHPSDWRNIDGIFKETQNNIKSKSLFYLEMHDKWEGERVFGAATTFDFYMLKNTPNNIETEIKCKSGIKKVNISNMDFIPNGMFSDFSEIMAKDGEEKVSIIYSRGLYGNDKKWMSKYETDVHKYPCIYYTYKNERMNIWYSSVNNGHFSIPKVIWSNGSASTPIVDMNGDYGVMNFACAITDDPENLNSIKKAMESEEFCTLMSFSNGVCGVGGQRYNNKVIKNLKKDFWKKFI